MFSLNGAGSIKIDRLIGPSLCAILNLNGAGSVSIDRTIGHSFCPILNLNGAGSVLYIESDKLDRLIGHSVLLR